VVRASGIAGRAARAGRPAVTTTAQATATAEDAESDAEPARTLDALRNTGDPNDVGRTPILGTDDIPVTPGEWPLGYPLQGVPRVAVTLSLQYVYNESEDQWERDTGFRSRAGDALNSRGVQTSQQSVPSGVIQRLDLDAARADSAGVVDTTDNAITVDDDGVYLLGAAVEFDGPADGDVIVASIEVDGTAVAKDQSPTVGGATNITAFPTVTVEIAGPAEVVCLIRHFTGQTETTSGVPEANQLYVTRLGAIPA